MYESPIKVFMLSNMSIQEDMEKQKKEFENKVFMEINKILINYKIFVEKEELIKALEYDRDQYNKGLKDGYDNGFLQGKRYMREHMEAWLQGEV